MKETGRNWVEWIVLVALCVCVCTAACAQPDPDTPHPLHAIEIQSPQTGSLSGRLTNLHSAPLAGVQVVLRNQATGTAAQTTTAKNGAFGFASLDAGEYALEADAPELGQGRLEGILITGGMEARVQAAMQFEPPAPALLEAAAPDQIPAPARAAPMQLTPSAPPAPARVAAPPVPMMASASPSTAPRVSAPLVFAPPAPTSAPAVPNPPRMTAPSRPSVAVSAPVATPLPAAPPSSLFVAPRPALNTVSAALTASIAAEPLQPMPLPASRTAEIARPIEQPFTPARTTLPAAVPPAASSGPRARAELETQSAAAQPALAVALPHAFPLKAGFVPDLSASTAVANGAQMLMRLKLPHLAPILAAVERIDPVTPAVASTVTATQLQALPVSGRRWQEFLLDTPAASTSADSSRISFRASQEPAEITIDGVSTRLAFGVAAGADSGLRASDQFGGAGEGAGQQSSTTQPWAGRRGLGVSEAAIHEVTTVAGNVEAEGLRSADGRTSISTESGGDTLHGQGFFFDRQNNWGAKNPFSTWVTETAPATTTWPLGTVPVFTPEPYTPQDHETVWGIGMGSRLRRDKLFWFAALDTYRRNDPGLATVKHPDQFFAQPSNAQLQLLSAQLDLSSANPVAEGLTAYSQMLGTLASLLGPAPRTAAQWAGFARIDWQAAERHHFTLEGIGADWKAPGGGLTRVSETFGNHSFGSSEASQEWLLARWEAYLTPNLLAVTQTSAGRDILTARPGAVSALEQPFLNGNSYGQLPEIDVDSAYGFTIGNPSRFGQGSYPDEKLYHAQETLDWVHNKLLVKAGFELDHNADVTSMLRNQTGTYHYAHVANFISDALSFEKYGFADALDPDNPHNCGATDTTFGSQPCYSSYSQMMGPTNWHLSTNDWAGYATAQWQVNKLAVFSAGLRWEREQLPPPIVLANNPELSLTEKLPSLGNNWGPRLSLAMGSAHSHWPVLRLGYGMYYGRTENTTIETALTQTGSLKGDLNFFMRPSADCQHCSGSAPPFPYVFTGQPSSVVKPGAVELAPNFRNPEAHQAVAAIEQPLPGRIELTAGAMLSLGRRLPINIDTNLTPPTSSQTITYTVCDEVPTGTNDTHCGQVGLGPITAATITVPFYAPWPSEACPMPPIPPNTACGGWNNASYQEIDQITSMANSTYEAAVVKVTRYGRRGLSLHAHYTYAHAMDWNPNESPLNPASLSPSFRQDFAQEYGASNQDVRHSAVAMVIFEAPWKLHNLAGKLGNGWMLSGIGQFHSGLPYTMRVTGSLPEESIPSGTIVGLRTGMNGSGGDSRVYGFGNNGQVYNIGRNTFRYPGTWKADLRLGKKFDLGETRQLEVMAESFNLFNHQNVTEIETTGYTIESGSSTSPPTLNFLTGLKTNPKTGLPIPGFGQPLDINGTDFYRERQIQLGLRMRF
jgi:hypothetical protein